MTKMELIKRIEGRLGLRSDEVPHFYWDFESPEHWKNSAAIEFKTLTGVVVVRVELRTHCGCCWIVRTWDAPGVGRVLGLYDNEQCKNGATTNG